LSRAVLQCAVLQLRYFEPRRFELRCSEMRCFADMPNFQLENFNIIDQARTPYTCLIKEALQIVQLRPNLNG